LALAKDHISAAMAVLRVVKLSRNIDHLIVHKALRFLES
jgi:hypothetical protein